jgi:hypothetical protein
LYHEVKFSAFDFQADSGFIVPCLVLCYHGHSGTAGEYEPPVLVVASFDDDDDDDAVVLVQSHDCPVPLS